MKRENSQSICPEGRLKQPKSLLLNSQSRVARLLICEPTRVMRCRLEQCNGLNMQPLLARQYSQCWLILIFKKGKRSEDEGDLVYVLVYIHQNTVLSYVGK
jgi:hypothetical protein